MMNVLLIAPNVPTQPALAMAETEVRAIAAQLRPLPLRGQVTRAAVLDAIVSQAWDVIWFVTHGDETGVLLSNEAIATADLTAQVRNSGAKLVVLNTCSSEAVGREIFHEAGCAVITTLTAIDDAMAYQTGALLARNLALGMTIPEAFEQSRPGGNLKYRLFGGAQQLEKKTAKRDVWKPELTNDWTP